MYAHHILVITYMRQSMTLVAISALRDFTSDGPLLTTTQSMTKHNLMELIGKYTCTDLTIDNLMTVYAEVPHVYDMIISLLQLLGTWLHVWI